MDLQFNIRPGLDPLNRGEIEDALVDALGGDAECVGGGGMLDGSESDFNIEVSGRSKPEIVACCREVIALLSFSQPTFVSLTIGGETHLLPTAIQVD